MFVRVRAAVAALGTSRSPVATLNTVALIVAALGLLGLGYAVYEMMTHAGPDAALKTAGGLAVYVIVCLALVRLSW